MYKRSNLEKMITIKKESTEEKILEALIRSLHDDKMVKNWRSAD